MKGHFHREPQQSEQTQCVEQRVEEGTVNCRYRVVTAHDDHMHTTAPLGSLGVNDAHPLLFSAANDRCACMFAASSFG